MSTVAKNETKDVALPMMSDEEITKMLRGAGAIEQGSQTNRIKIDGAMFVVGDEMYPYNAAKKEPAFIARLVGPIVEYQGAFIGEHEADFAGGARKDDEGKYCKSYFLDPTQARKTSNTGYSCRECPINPFIRDLPFEVHGCKWRGELELQIIPPSGQLNGDEPIWMLDLSTTSVIEFKGTKKNPTAGSVSAENFMHKLAKFALKQAAANKDDMGTAVLKALDAYNKGGVVAEFRLLGATSANSANTWRVVSLEPIAIVDIPEAPAIEAGPVGDDTGNPDKFEDLPF